MHNSNIALDEVNDEVANDVDVDVANENDDLDQITKGASVEILVNDIMQTYSSPEEEEFNTTISGHMHRTYDLPITFLR